MSTTTDVIVKEYLDDIINGRAAETENKMSLLWASYIDACQDLDDQLKTCAEAAKSGNGLFETYRNGIAERRERVEQTRAQLLDSIDAEAELKERLRGLRVSLNQKT